MNTTQTRSTAVTAVFGAAIAGIAAPTLLFLGAGTAHAVEDVSERTPRDCGSCFNPQPDPPGNPNPESRSPMIGNPDEGQLGGPDTKVSVGTARSASPSLNPGDAVGIIIINS